jgi:hypothetical protein
MSEKVLVAPAAVKLNPGKLLGFHRLAAFEPDPQALREALQAAHNKIGETPPPPAPAR